MRLGRTRGYALAAVEAEVDPAFDDAEDAPEAPPPAPPEPDEEPEEPEEPEDPDVDAPLRESVR